MSHTLPNKAVLQKGQTELLYSKTNLQLFLLADTMNTAVYVINRTGPTKQGNKTPYELWYGRLTGIENFKVFERKYFVHVSSEKRKKLDKKGKIHKKQLTTII